jgi:hypothetical protein
MLPKGKRTFEIAGRSRNLLVGAELDDSIDRFHRSQPFIDLLLSILCLTNPTISAAIIEETS